MSATRPETRTPIDQRKVATGNCRAALKELDAIRLNARMLARKLEKLADEVDDASYSVMNSLGWLRMEPDAIASEIAERPEDFPPVA